MLCAEGFRKSPQNFLLRPCPGLRCPLHPSWDQRALADSSVLCRYEEIQRAQEELGAGMAEVAAEARRALAAVEQAQADLAETFVQVAALGQVSSIQATAPAGIPTSCFTSASSLDGR